MVRRAKQAALESDAMCAQDRLAETIVIDVRKLKAEAPMAGQVAVDKVRLIISSMGKQREQGCPPV
jgi:hypothetical protein